MAKINLQFVNNTRWTAIVERNGLAPNCISKFLSALSSQFQSRPPTAITNEKIKIKTYKTATQRCPCIPYHNPRRDNAEEGEVALQLLLVSALIDLHLLAGARRAGWRRVHDDIVLFKVSLHSNDGQCVPPIDA